MSSLVDKYIDQLATKLIKKVKNCKEAIDTKIIHIHITLHDSYGAGVYKDKKVLQYTKQAT